MKSGRILILCVILAAFHSLSFSLACRAQSGDPVVVLQTTKGPIAMRIFRGMAPDTAGNFLDLVSRGFYNGLIFHRVENWCIQGGDPAGNGTGNFVDPQTGRARFLRLEINPNLSHRQAGVVAMARARDPNSASCQFYITKAAMPMLDRQYAIFAVVIDGMNVVQQIQRGDRIISAEIVDSGIRQPPVPQEQSPPLSKPGRPNDSGF